MKKVRLEVCPAQQSKQPAYPDMACVQAYPELLASTPSRWKGSPLLCAALALTVAAGLCGCARNVHIPVFKHGNGLSTGYFGCVSVVAPALFSEEDAVHLIHEEFADRNLDFSAERVIGAKPDELDEDMDSFFPLEVDGYSKRLCIGFEYISENDYMESGMWFKYSINHSAAQIDYSRIAAGLSDAVPNTAFFYYPGKNPELRNDEEQWDYAAEQLRLQVRDFLDWLAAEGII